MLKLIEDKKAKITAQASFEKNLRAAWNEHERRMIVWRPSKKELDIAHNGDCWFTSVKPSDSQKTRRYWNSIGRYSESGDLQITVEINIPTESNSEQVSGFFAVDETGTLCLMHDGGVGGGRKGIGRTSFLAWSGAKLIPVINAQDKVRHGIIVTPVESTEIGANVARFLETVERFKQAVKNKEIDDNIVVAEEDDVYRDYFREFSGVKMGQRTQEIEYITRHGNIVHALSKWRKKRSGERIVKDPYIDLGVVDNGNKLIELYEVKTNADRQTLYTAIGQIIVHGVGNNHIKRFIVLPDLLIIPNDVTAALAALRITILRFKMTVDMVTIL